VCVCVCVSVCVCGATGGFCGTDSFDIYFYRRCKSQDVESFKLIPLGLIEERKLKCKKINILLFLILQFTAGKTGFKY
jgi:hypothetical protein